MANNIDNNQQFRSLFTLNTKQQSLSDLFYEAFYLLTLVKNGNYPNNIKSFRENLFNLLNDIEEKSKKINISQEDIYAVKYAFCAAIDEVILTYAPNISYEWQRNPLQLIFFGDHLGGEKFFILLEDIRRVGASRVQALEVFYIFLLLGFKGKYFIDPNNELTHLINRIEEEIKYHKDKKIHSLSPHAISTDNISNSVGRNFSLFTMIATFMVLSFITFAGLKWQLNSEIKNKIQGFAGLIHTPQKNAEIIITLP